jgi:hypothetical protein
MFLSRLSAGPILGLIHDHSEQLGWKKGVRRLFAKENRNNLAKILQVFSFSGKERRRVLKGCLWE